MALRTINLNNSVDQWKTNYNSLATDVGDLSLLGTTHDSNLVLAINELIGEYDSATVIRLARNSFSAGTGLSYDSSIGRFTLGTNNIITFAMMTDSSVGVTELRNDAVTTAKILDDAVTYAKIQNVATANRLLGSTTAGGAVSEVRLTTAMITPSAVDSAAIGSLAVSTAKIQADAVTSAKLASSVTLIIYSSAGTALKTLYGAGA
jgi:hypothetical protein